MRNFKEKLQGLVLPSWMDKGEPATLLRAAKRYWLWVYDWLMWPFKQLDAETCHISLLHVLAYQRDITRFKGEPLPLFRRRVKYAFVNAEDAGSVAGFIRIFERLGVGYVEILERQPGIDWDVIIIRVTDSQVSENPDLLINITRQYGRTCRRYRFEVMTNNHLLMRFGYADAEYCVFGASLI